MLESTKKNTFFKFDVQNKPVLLYFTRTSFLLTQIPGIWARPTRLLTVLHP